MAGSILIPLKAVFDDKGIKDAQRSFGKMGSSLKGALGAVGITLGISALTTGLMNATKAASDDAKSQIILAQQLRNTTDATNGQIAAVESSISSLSIMAGVADDQLRPAMASLVRATGDVGTAQNLLKLSLDVSAATGKDLGAVSLALGKAYAGQTSQLFRMIPALKGSKDFMAKLQTETEGMAEAAGNADPYMQLNIIFDEMQETIGTALLPVLKDMADYFSSPAGQDEIVKTAENIRDVTAALGGLVEFSRGVGQVIDATGLGYLFAVITGDFDKATKLLNNIGIATNLKYGLQQKELYEAMQKSSSAVVSQTKSIVVNSQAKTDNASATKSTSSATKENTAALKASKAAQEANSQARIKYWEDLVKTRELLKEQAEAEAELQTQLIETRKELQASTAGFGELFKAQADVGEFESNVVSSFGNVKQAISTALSDGKITESAASSLNLLANSTESSLKAIGKQLDQLTAKRIAAQNLFDDVKGSILGAGNLTGLLESQSKSVTKTVTSIINGIQVAVSSTTEEVTTGGLLKNFKAVLDKTKAFAEQLKTLKKLGLDQNLFKQIVDAGADAGGAIASEIIAGGADSVKEINSVYKDLADVSGQIAEQTAVVFFNDGKDVVGGLVNGLLAQEAQLVDAATTLANAFLSTFNSLIANLKVPTTTTTVGAASMNLYDVAKNLAGSTEAYFSSSESINQARIAQRNNAPITVVVNAGVGTNGKAVGAAIQAELNKYASANA